MSARKQKPAKKARTLRDFVRDNARKDCPVCQLRPDLLEQIVLSRRQEIRLDVVSEWLRVEHKIVITSDQLLTHQRAGHNNVK